MIKQHRDYQRQTLVPGVEMTLHRSNSVTHQPEGHIFIGRALMLNQAVDIAFATVGIQ